jgi:hypothetical protein
VTKVVGVVVAIQSTLHSVWVRFEDSSFSFEFSFDLFSFD